MLFEGIFPYHWHRCVRNLGTEKQMSSCSPFLRQSDAVRSVLRFQLPENIGMYVRIFSVRDLRIASRFGGICVMHSFES